jgi:acetylornithine deacetylase
MSLDYQQYQSRLAQLVALESVSCTDKKLDKSNLPVVSLLANWLENMGFACEIQAVPNWPGKYNLIAVKGSGGGGLVLSGHSDTVPCNPELWQQNPLQLTERDGRFYGLGAVDMKGFFPVVLAALEACAQLTPKQPIIILATADEESSMCGARALAQQGNPQARYAVIGEPTSMRPIRMHKGIVMESVRVQGQAGHSSNPALGKNALEVMHKVIGQILLYRDHLQQTYSNPGFAVSVPTLNLGCIHGGDNPNRICPSCELHFDLRPLPGMPLEQIRQDLQNQLRPIAEKAQCDIVFSSLFPGIEPFEENANSALVKAAERLTGNNATAVAFATEAPFLQKMGMQTIVMGPGDINQAHQPNEYIDQREIAPAVEVIKALIKEFCY